MRVKIIPVVVFPILLLNCSSFIANEGGYGIANLQLMGRVHSSTVEYDPRETITSIRIPLDFRGKQDVILPCLIEEGVGLLDFNFNTKMSSGVVTSILDTVLISEMNPRSLAFGKGTKVIPCNDKTRAGIEITHNKNKVFVALPRQGVRPAKFLLIFFIKIPRKFIGENSITGELCIRLQGNPAYGVIDAALSTKGKQIGCNNPVDSPTFFRELVKADCVEHVKMMLDHPNYYKIDVNSNKTFSAYSSPCNVDSPLLSAVENNSEEMVKLLLTSPNINVNCGITSSRMDPTNHDHTEPYHVTPLARAEYLGYTNIVKILKSAEGVVYDPPSF